MRLLSLFESKHSGARQWLTHVISATQEAEIEWIMVQGQPREKVSETPHLN
jgi:hypothetical protein